MTTETTTQTAGDGALAFITASLAAGRTVHIATMTRITEVTPKTAARWSKAGLPLFKVVGGDLYMASGRSFVKLTAGAITLVGITAR